jgi:hypothetical protein
LMSRTRVGGCYLYTLQVHSPPLFICQRLTPPWIDDPTVGFTKVTITQKRLRCGDRPGFCGSRFADCDGLGCLQIFWYLVPSQKPLYPPQTDQNVETETTQIKLQAMSCSTLRQAMRQCFPMRKTSPHEPEVRNPPLTPTSYPYLDLPPNMFKSPY